MKFTGPTYRPPFEADSILLQVTVGCSHNKCKFCSMYRDVSFKIASMEDIENDLQEIRRLYPHVKKIFLVNGDPFALSAGRLAKIAEKINEIFPEIETIAMYASIRNIAGKTDDELKNLRSLKISNLNIGLESGLLEVVKYLNKGFTIEEAECQLKRLNSFGIAFSINIIIGAGGSHLSREHALASAKFLNKIKPELLFIATLHLENDSPLKRDLEKGKFKENNLEQNIEEELLLLKSLKLDNTIFFGRHPSNAIPLYGRLPEDKLSLIRQLEKGISHIHPRFLITPNSELIKGNEGALLLA